MNSESDLKDVFVVLQSAVGPLSTSQKPLEPNQSGSRAHSKNASKIPRLPHTDNHLTL